MKFDNILNNFEYEGSSPKAVLPLRFHLFYVWCCSVFKCLNSSTSACPIRLVQ